MKRLYAINPFGLLLFFLPGAGLVIFSCFILFKNIHHHIFWIKTTGEIIGLEQRYMDDGFYVFEKAVFTDKDGKQVEVIANTSAGSADQALAASGKVTIYYQSENSSNAIIFSLRNYLPILFFPFGVLLIFLGWPVTTE